jgi:hypothetical protein
MKKLLVISSHFSTGGAPQVVVNKVQLMKDDFEIKVIEWSFLSSIYVVQRNRIIDLIGESNFISFNGDDAAKYEQLVNVLKEFNPDLVSMEEFPEFFMDNDSANYLYNKNIDRLNYYITETTHDSSFNLNHKRFYPDKFIFVSPYNGLKLIEKGINVPFEVLEYPVDNLQRDKAAARRKLGLEDDYRHVVIVGLFTQRKNQGYAFELAYRMKDKKIKFHFIGNMAGNFESYWRPIIDWKNTEPILDNCILWGERNDVDDFVQASDVYLFPSRGDRNNKELNPIALKESGQYADLPKLLFNLDVYLNRYNNVPNFHYLSGDADIDAAKLIELAQPETKRNNANDIIIIGTYPNLKSRVQLTKDCINSLKPLGRKIMLVSHYPVDAEIQRMVDYYIYDAENILTYHSYYTRFYTHQNDFDVEININGLKNTNQSLTVLMNMHTAVKAASEYGFVNALYITYDVIVNPKDYAVIEESFDYVDEQCSAYLSTLKTPFGHGIQTTAMTFNTGYFAILFDDVRTENEYNEICNSIGAQNFLEDYFMKCVNGRGNDTIKIITNEQETFLVNSGLGTSSNSEYYSIVPVVGSENKWMFYFYSYNIDDRIVRVNIEAGAGEVFQHQWRISESREYKKLFEFNGVPVIVTVEFWDGDNKYKTEVYEINDGNVEKHKSNGVFKFKNQKSKIKLVHIQTTRDEEREKESRRSLEEVSKYGIEYILHRNVPYGDLPPQHNCIRPSCVSMELFNDETLQRVGTALTPAHYGCFEAFKLAIMTEFDDDLDFLMVCEGDCLLEVPMAEFVDKVNMAASICKENNIGYFSFGDTRTLEHGWLQSNTLEEIPNQDLLFITDKIIGLQCIMFSKAAKKFLMNMLRQHKWDAADIYFNTIFRFSPFKMGILHNRITTQVSGYSLIDQQEKKFL